MLPLIEPHAAALNKERKNGCWRMVFLPSSLLDAYGVDIPVEANVGPEADAARQEARATWGVLDWTG